MSYRIIAVPSFSRDAKRLSKKYASLKGELQTLQSELLQNPRLGTLIRENTYKIRLAVKSKGKGKSGGWRRFSPRVPPRRDVAIIVVEI